MSRSEGVCVGNARSGAEHLYPMCLRMYPNGFLPDWHGLKCPSDALYDYVSYIRSGRVTSTVSRAWAVPRLAERQRGKRAGPWNPVPGDVLSVSIGEEADVETGKVLKEAF